MPHHRVGVAHSNPMKQDASIQVGFPRSRKHILNCASQELWGTIGLTMRENDGIDLLAAAHGPPIERPDFEYFVLNHESAQR